MRKPSAKQLENGIADIGGKMLESGHADEGVAVAVEFGAPPMRELPWRLSSGLQTVIARLPGM